MKTTLTILLTLPFTLALAEPLFNGKDLSEWESKPDLGHWSVENGVITGANGPKKKGSVLWTKKAYGEFVLEGEFRFDGVIDSGVFVKGGAYQVNIGISSSLKVDMTASIYAPSDKRGKYPAEAKGVKDILKMGEWNRIRIQAKGKRILIALNGKDLIDYETKALPVKGPIGLQVHPGLDMKIEFRNLAIEEQGTAAKE